MNTSQNLFELQKFFDKIRIKWENSLYPDFKENPGKIRIKFV